MSVIFCRREQVSHPYYIENLGVHVYTSQELCYVIYHHPLLAMDDFINQSLIDFIRNELDMGFTALKMERRIKAGENADETLFLFLKECGYYTSGEINGLRQKISGFRKLPVLEYVKKNADYLFEYKQYGKAIASYIQILEDVRYSRMDQRFQGRIWNNLAACYARVFQLGKAMEAYEQAYEKTGDETVLEKIFYLTKLDSKLSVKEAYQPAVTEEKKGAWEGAFVKAGELAKDCKEQETLRELFTKDPIRRMEGAWRMVEGWKQEYRGMA